LQQLLKLIISTENITNATKKPTAKITKAPFRFFRVKGVNELCEESDVISFAFSKQRCAFG